MSDPITAARPLRDPGIAFADVASTGEDGRIGTDLEKAGTAQPAGILGMRVCDHSKQEHMASLKLGGPPGAEPVLDQSRQEQRRVERELEDAGRGAIEASARRDVGHAGHAAARPRTGLACRRIVGPTPRFRRSCLTASGHG